MHGFRSLVAATATALLTATATLAGATPAHATTIHSVTVTLTDGSTPGCNATTVITTSQTVVTANPGDTLRIVFNSAAVTTTAPAACGYSLTAVPTGGRTGWDFYGLDLGTSPSSGFDTSFSTYEFTVGTVNIDVKSYLSGLGLEYGLIFRVILAGSSVDETPRDFIQQFAISSAGTCESVPNDIPVFNVSRSGGWGKSWAQWPNEGQGGFVCTRTVRYEPSIQGWAPRV